ncbi:MAG: aminotransferase class V-fold PLP-dependent enzyme, partial [Planctomycetota bacterium]
EAAIGPKTRLIVVDHVTSPTAFILPIHAIVDRAREKGIDVLVDGAHAPGMLDLNLDDLNAAYYVGNLHKWVGAPRGAAFLRVSPDRQQGIHPTTISHFLDQGFTQEFDWQGTRDISPWLCTSTAIDVMAEVGWDRIRQHNHALAVWVGDLLCRRWDVAPISPPDGSMIGSMVTVPLPDGFDQWAVPEALSAYLSATHSFEVPIVDWAGRRWLRASCQIYNRPQEYEHLADVMLSLAHRDPVTDAVIASQPLD